MVGMTKSITGRKTKIRHRTFMPPKMRKIPKMTLPNFRSKPKPELKSIKRRAEGGPWDGKFVSVRLLSGDTTMVIRVGDYHGCYVMQWGEIFWRPTNGS